MLISIEQKEILNCLKKFNGISKKSNVPYSLSNVLIENDFNGLNTIKLTVINKDVSMAIYCKCHDLKDVADSGFTVELKELLAAIKGFNKNDIISFTVVNKLTLNIALGSVEFNLPIIRSSEKTQSSLNKAEDGLNFELSRFQKLIRNVLSSTGQDYVDKLKYTGVYFQFDKCNPKCLQAVATNGSMMALSEISPLKLNTESSTYNALKTGVIVPQKALRCILKLESSDNVNLVIEEENIFFNFCHAEIWTTAIKDIFPDYKFIIEGTKDDKKIAIMDTKTILSSIKKISNSIKQVELKFSNNVLIIETESSTMKNSISYKGIPVNISLNPKYITDFICNIAEQRIKFKFNEANTPVTIEPILEDTSISMGMSGVIMPIRRT